VTACGSQFKMQTPLEREIYWNIPKIWVIIHYSLFAIAGLIFLYGAYKHFRLIRLGKQDNRFSFIARRIYNSIYYACFQRRILEKPYQGLTHTCIFYGLALLFLGTLLVLVQADFGIIILKGEFYKWFSLVMDLSGAALLLGLGLAVFRRYVLRPAELESSLDDFTVIAFLGLLGITGFMLEGFRMAVTEIPNQSPLLYFSPFGFVTGKIFLVCGFSESLIKTLYPILWLTHSTLLVGLVAYFPWSKLVHIFTGPVNIFCRDLNHPGELSKIDLETTEEFGITKITDFSWKHLLDLDSCTRCGRCNTGCPTNLTQKPLKPKQLIQNLKDSLFKSPKLENQEQAKEESLFPNTVTYDEIWSCTTCRFCQSNCPVFIEHLPKIIEFRRNLVLAESNFPPEIKTMFKNLETNGNPWPVSWDKRSDWCKDLGVKVLNEGDKTDVLLWVGCAGATDDRNTKVARALVSVLQKAGVDFAILGNAERCCGDPARRIGNEYLYQQLAEENVQTLKKYSFSKILATCPHCFNTLKNEYPQMNGNFKVIHHTEFILKLIQKGKLSIPHSEIRNPQSVIYHDSCYLGRYNNIYEAPRQILQSIKGLKVKEMPRHHKKSFCCGAGGGRMWMEEKLGTRINQSRIQEAMKVADKGMVITACPYCLTMLSDGIKEKGLTDNLQALDIVEMLTEDKKTNNT
jgi:Fe-S oxidoreductase/nitrate reductase gamma subunit